MRSFIGDAMTFILACYWAWDAAYFDSPIALLGSIAFILIFFISNYDKLFPKAL